MNEQFEMIAKTFQGLEEILAEELTALGANDIQIGRRMVSFTGDKRMMYKANFCLRTAILSYCCELTVNPAALNTSSASSDCKNSMNASAASLFFVSFNSATG